MFFLFLLLKIMAFLALFFLILLFFLIFAKTSLTLSFKGDDKKYIAIQLYNSNIIKMLSFRYFLTTNQKQFRFLNIPIQIQPQKKTEQKKREKKVTSKSKKPGPVTILEIFEKKDFFKSIIKKFYDRIENIKVDGDLTIGLGDPYQTGLMLGFYNSIWYIIPQIKNISIEPDFFNYRMDG
ncbi:MAG: DUF2953 domain-containing protein, partial [Candidatus Marinimicrobia bacterium]|nr:DUF2953 domain-containing protein [Candidatus Neomarinimicrobiota bacterium]